MQNETFKKNIFEKQERYKRAFQIFNSEDGELVIEYLDKIVCKRTDFNNSNVNYYRDGAQFIINFINQMRGKNGK